MQKKKTTKQGLTVSHSDILKYVASEKADEQSLLFERIPHIEDVQAAWFLLTFFAATRANNWLRTVPRDFTQHYAEVHDRSVNRCLERILPMDGIPQHIWGGGFNVLTFGGLGVGGASRMPHIRAVGQIACRWCKICIPTSPTQSWEGWSPAHQGI